MPVYEIEDEESGMKITVEGDSPPSEAESEDLVESGFDLVTMKLFDGLSKLPEENLVKLAAGLPNGGMDAILSSNTASGEVNNLVREVSREIIKKEPEKFASGIERIAGGDWLLGRDTDLKSYLFATAEPGGFGMRLYPDSTVEQKLGAPAKNTLAVRGHGSPGMPFLSQSSSSVSPLDFIHPRDIAAYLGSDRTNVHNVIQESCYGGNCYFDQWKSAFPNMTNLVRTKISQKAWAGDIYRMLKSVTNDLDYISVQEGKTEKFDPKTILAK